jgi:UDP:flavonoid glycosyltransferase YjiC (YdhE family)
MRKTKNILIAPLNWGLGHATRCIPIIKKFQEEGHRIIIASDGAALQFLKKEFPELIFEELPAYNIKYTGNQFTTPLYLLLQVPRIWQTVKQEKKVINTLIDQYKIDWLISDNRFGVYSDKVKSVYITHQLRVKSGLFTPITSFIHYIIYKKYDEIWVPDIEKGLGLSGSLGHIDKLNGKIKYIGIQQRMQYNDKLPKQYDILAILSGPEPQRSLLEKKLIENFNSLPLKTAIVQGIVAQKKQKLVNDNMTIYNFLGKDELEQLINTSDVIISRSGYTSIMDLALFPKKIIWVPTPGQFEQDYLAKYLNQKFGFTYINQKQLDITPDLLNQIKIIDINI